MRGALPEGLLDALPEAPTGFRTVAGGDIGESLAVDLASGDRVFVKRYGVSGGGATEGRSRGARGIAASEAHGLAWLAEANALRVPEVIAHAEAGDPEDWLALEWIEEGRRAADFDALLGTGLARVHAAGAPCFGLDQDNWIGPLPQANPAESDWPDFYARARIRPLLDAADRAGRLPRAARSAIEAVLEAMAELVGPAEPPARLHGDLWSGNVIADERGQPCLIDPAVYGGHREIDLAMMRLFGGFGEACFTAYAEIAPLAPGLRARVPLYQLYPLLVHVNLFGGHYARSAEQAAKAALAGLGGVGDP